LLHVLLEERKKKRKERKKKEKGGNHYSSGKLIFNTSYTMVVVVGVVVVKHLSVKHLFLIKFVRRVFKCIFLYCFANDSNKTTLGEYCKKKK